MKKKKKISFRYYLDSRLKPNKEGEFPLYLRVNFDTKNTKIVFHESNKSFSPVFVSEKQLQDKSFHSEEFEKTIENIIRYEYQFFGEKFHLSGLGNRLQFYGQSVKEKINNDVISDLNEFLLSNFKKPVYEYLTLGKLRNKAYLVYAAIKKISPNVLEKIPSSLQTKLNVLEAFNKYQGLDNINCYELIVLDEAYQEFSTYFPILSDENLYLFEIIFIKYNSLM